MRDTKPFLVTAALPGTARVPVKETSQDHTFDSTAFMILNVLYYGNMKRLKLQIINWTILTILRQIRTFRDKGMEYRVHYFSFVSNGHRPIHKAHGEFCLSVSDA